MPAAPSELRSPVTQWCERQVEVPNPQGLHARPAHLIVEVASQFKADITIRRDDDKDVNAKSTIQLLTLVAEQGSLLTIRAQGEDAPQAIDALADLVRRGFDEMEKAV